MNRIKIKIQNVINQVFDSKHRRMIYEHFERDFSDLFLPLVSSQ